MKKIWIVSVMFLIATTANAKNVLETKSDEMGSYAAYQVNFDGNPVFNLYGLCVNGDSIQSVTAYSNCKTWGSGGCVELDVLSHHPEKIARIEMQCKPGTEGSEGDCAASDQIAVRTSFPLRYEVAVEDPNWDGTGEGANIIGRSIYTIPNCR